MDRYSTDRISVNVKLGEAGWSFWGVLGQYREEISDVTHFPSRATQKYYRLQHKVRNSTFKLRNQTCSGREREDNRRLHSHQPLWHVKSCQSVERYIYSHTSFAREGVWMKHTDLSMWRMTFSFVWLELQDGQETSIPPQTLIRTHNRYLGCNDWA
jgi:hypothetical protein